MSLATPPTNENTTLPAEAEPLLQLQVFDRMGIVQDHVEAVVGGRRQRRLLALLAIRVNTTVSPDWLIEYLWDDNERPSGARGALRTYLSRLRNVLPSGATDWIETDPLGYRLSIDPTVVEHLRFSALRREARRARDRGEARAALALLDAALGLWRGLPFRELEDLDWAAAEIEGLHLEYLEMQEERWETSLDLGLHTQIVGELAAFNHENSLRERARSQLALALHRSGRTHDALQVLQEYRQELVEEKGLDPSPSILDLESALLARDPALDLERTERSLRGYRILELIGEGAFSEVWRGVQPSVNRDVAIKQIRFELASRPDFIRRFEAEAHTIARLEHPHIVPLIDFWRDPDSAYLVMRWLRGGTLEAKLAEGAFSLERTVEIARQIGGALSAAHAHGVIHRDVKSANIFLDDAGNAFLGDFGIAIDVTDVEATTISYGSPAYASPEQLAHSRLGPASDEYSLGVVLFQCLAGTLPHPGATSDDEVRRRRNGPGLPRINELRSDISQDVAAVIAKATEKDPDDRFGSLAEFIEAFEAAALGPGSDEAPEALLAEPINPYMGLRAFGEDDAGRFHSREEFVTELLERLAETEADDGGCVVVVGPSGSGKSSVVRAGLLPALRAGAIPGSKDWFRISMIPGLDPFESLEMALRSIAVSPPASLLTVLTSGRNGILSGIEQCLGSNSDRLVMVIDQFEELFFGDVERANKFLDGLSEAVAAPGSRLLLVVTLRADYYDRPLHHPEFSKLMKKGAIDLLPLGVAELERVMVEPAADQGIVFEPGLVSEIVADAVGQPSALPLLQHVLSELFVHRTGSELRRADYRRIGGMAGALASTAEIIYTSGDEPQRSAVRRVFEQMTRVGDDAIDVRRRVLISDLGKSVHTGWVLEHFGAARLLSFDRDSQSREPTVEVAHEALLREWPRLVRWLEQDRDLMRSVEVLATAADVWAGGGRDQADLHRDGRLEQAMLVQQSAPERLRPVDQEFVDASQELAETLEQSERRRLRLLRNLVTAFGIALLLALIAGGIAGVQRARANDEAARAGEAAAAADNQRGIAEDQARIALEQEVVAEQQRDLAEEALRDVDTLTNELENLIILRGVGDDEADRLLDLASTIDFATARQNDVQVSGLEVIEVTDKSAKVLFNTSECSDAMWTVSRFGSAGGVALDRCADSHQLLLGRSPFSSGPLTPDTTYTVDVAGVLDDGSRSTAGRLRFTTLPAFDAPPQIRDLEVSEITATTAVVTFKVDQCTGAEFTIGGVTYHADGYPGRQDLCWVNQWARIGDMPVGPGPLSPNTDYTVEVRAMLVDGTASGTQTIDFTTSS